MQVLSQQALQAAFFKLSLAFFTVSGVYDAAAADIDQVTDRPQISIGKTAAATGLAALGVVSLGLALTPTRRRAS